MRALSANTSVADPYRAGIALGEALRPVSPEVVFLFASHQYASAELLEGLHDALDDERVVVAGCSGDGVYETSRVAHVGAAALALNTDGKARFLATHSAGLGADTEGCTERCLAQLRELAGGATPAFLFMASDFRADSTKVEAALQRATDVPVVGGFAADDNSLKRCFVAVGRELLEDALVLVGAYGDIAFEIAVGNTVRSVGRAGVIDEADGVEIRRIDGLGATDFVERETGKPALQADRGIVSLSVLDPATPSLRRLRSVIPSSEPNGRSLGLYGSIAAGQTVQVCVAEPDDLVREAYAMAEQARAASFEPAAALLVSCAGRKWLLGSRIEHEVTALTAAFPHGLPLAGFPSFAEFAPLKQDGRYTRTFAHNMTFVLLLLGDRR